MKGKTSKILALIGLVTFTVGMLALQVNSINLGDSDYIAFWAAGKQLVHHRSPYDASALLDIQRQEGLTGPPNVSLDLPSAFFIVLPLGLVGAKTGAILWLLAFMLSLVLSIRLLYILHGRPKSNLHMLCYLFAPWYVCLMAAQLGPFLLLGLVLFFYFCEARPFWAGFALLLCAIKPHLFLPFAIVLLGWICYRRAFPILAGFAASVAASCALSFYFDAQAWSEYSSLMRTNPGLLTAFVPTLSVALRFAVNRNAMWVQYLPAIAACIWGLWYFWTRRATWSWLDHGSLLLAVSILCAPHGWIFDEVVLLPVILAGLYAVQDSRLLQIALLAMSGFVVIEFLRGAKPVSPYYLWTAPAWFAWYLVARAHARKQIRQSTLVSS